MKILLVEDDIEISDMLKNFLMTENFEVITAYDGESACEKFSTDLYSLVLLDLMIPKKSGLEVMKSIREKSTVPIIIISTRIQIRRLVWGLERMIILQNRFPLRKYWQE